MTHASLLAGQMSVGMSAQCTFCKPCRMSASPTRVCEAASQVHAIAHDVLVKVTEFPHLLLANCHIGGNCCILLPLGRLRLLDRQVGIGVHDFLRITHEFLSFATLQPWPDCCLQACKANPSHQRIDAGEGPAGEWAQATLQDAETTAGPSAVLVACAPRSASNAPFDTCV